MTRDKREAPVLTAYKAKAPKGYPKTKLSVGHSGFGNFFDTEFKEGACGVVTHNDVSEENRKRGKREHVSYADWVFKKGTLKVKYRSLEDIKTQRDFYARERKMEADYRAKQSA